MIPLLLRMASQEARLRRLAERFVADGRFPAESWEYMRSRIDGEPIGSLERQCCVVAAAQTLETFLTEPRAGRDEEVN